MTLKTMAEVKMSQAQLPNRFPSISPPKPHEPPNARRTNRSRRTNNSADRDSYDMTPSVHGRPSTPTSAMQVQPPGGVELPKLIHLNPLLEPDPRRPYGIGRAATTMTGEPVGFFNIDCLNIIPQPLTPSPTPHRVKKMFKNSSKMQNVQGGMPSSIDDDDPELNLPYQGSFFKSATVMRMYTIPRRHPEMFSSRESLYYNKKKGVILHTDRYRWEEKTKVERPVDEKSQRDRLEAEMDHIEKVKGMKRQLDSALPHRMEHDLLMGGKKVEFTERVDISGELARLRAMVLPTDAKDLYIGKGIGTRLPKFHQINKPRGPPVADPPELLGSPTGAPKTNPTLTVNNIKFVSPARTEAGSEVRPTWSKDEDDAESDMEIDLPAEAGDTATPRPQDKTAVTPRGDVSSSPIKAVTPNPLKFVDPGIADEERDMLRETFKRLDTDSDGHILYQQIKTQLPNTVTSAQEKYIKQVYDITSASTFFGVEEFYTMTALINKFNDLSGSALDAYEMVDMLKMKDRIVQYVELFQTVDRSGKGSISVESVEEIICQAMEKNQESDKDFLKQIFDVLKPDGDDNINKLEFILHIPYFCSLEKPDTGSTRKST